MNSFVLFFISILLLNVSKTRAALVESISPLGIEQRLLAPFIIDVNLNKTSSQLQLFMNTHVRNHTDPSGRDPVITDVGPANTYTTFHVNIEFSGKNFVDKNIRFCDMLAVKNTSSFRKSPRFDSKHSSPNPKIIGDHGNIQKRDQENANSQTNLTWSSLANDYNSSSGVLGTDLLGYDGDLIQCPLYNNDTLALYYEVDLVNFESKFGSFTVEFSVVSNAETPQIIGYAKTYVTVSMHDNLADTTNSIILLFLLITFSINILFVVYSAHQETSNPFLIMASTICNNDLLKQLDASAYRIIDHLQFAFFLAALDLQYPGFYQPLISSIQWCALLGINFYDATTDEGRSVQDHIYVTYGNTGIRSLLTIFSGDRIFIIWSNFMMISFCWVFLLSLLFIIYLLCKKWYSSFKMRRRGENNEEKAEVVEGAVRGKFLFLDSVRVICFICGIFASHFFYYFAFPFLVLSFCLIYSIGQDWTSINTWKFLTEIQSNLFDMTVSYKELFPVAVRLHGKEKEKTFKAFASNSLILLSWKGYSIQILHVVIVCIFLVIWFTLASFFIFNYVVSFSFKKFRIVTNKKISKLYTSVKVILLCAFAYHRYHPDNVKFLIIDLIAIICRSLIVSCFQFSGILQVTLFLILELVIAFLFLRIKPFFVKLSVTSLWYYLTFARILAILLCFPCIHQFNLSEETRTSVIFAQITVHASVAIFFIIRLAYCVFIVCKSFYKGRKKASDSTLDSQDTSAHERPSFEFLPVVYVGCKSSEEEGSENNSDGTTDPKYEFDNISEDFYYRGNNAYNNVHDGPVFPERMYYTKVGEDVTIFNSDSFDIEQRDSIIRKRGTNYCVRESDVIYHNYFVNDAIDPDIKQLWDSRNNWSSNLAKTKKGEKADAFRNRYGPLSVIFKSVKSKLGYESEVIGFEVARPKQLVIKKLSDLPK